MKSSVVESFLPAHVYPLSYLLWAATKLQFGTFQAPPSYSQTSEAEKPPPVIMRPVRCAPSLLEPGTLLSAPCLFMMSSEAMSTIHSPAGPPGWLSSRSAPIYAVHTHILPRVRDRPKNSLTSKTSSVIYKLHLLQMMASLLCNVMILCHRPESALSSHVRLWMAFWLPSTSSLATHPATSWRRLSNAICSPSTWTRQSLVSLKDATPVQPSGTLQLHVLTSPPRHHLKLSASPLQQM